MAQKPYPKGRIRNLGLQGVRLRCIGPHKHVQKATLLTLFHGIWVLFGLRPTYEGPGKVAALLFGVSSPIPCSKGSRL